ncbi:MAG: helix-turn-helix transcriptional regulator [Hyphomicrobium sp.]|jgi:transcriptional regulator with XRE-family HTH domain
MGQRLREARQSRGLTQTEVGRALGVSFQQIQKYERGANRISLEMLLLLNERLGIVLINDGVLSGRRPFQSSDDLNAMEADLVRHFRAVKNEQVRERVLELIRVLADMG